MTLTTQNKIEIIQAILDDEGKRTMDCGICNWIALRLQDKLRNNHLIQGKFGLTKYRPFIFDVYWWPRDESGYAKRLEVLRCVLQDLKEELQRE